MTVAVRLSRLIGSARAVRLAVWSASWLALVSGCEVDPKCGHGGPLDTCRPGIVDTGDAAAASDAGGDAAANADIDASATRDAAVGTLDAQRTNLDANLDGAPPLFDSNRPWPDAGYRFLLANVSDAALYIQQADFNNPSTALALYEDGRSVELDGRCELCSCDQCPRCWLCGRSVARVARIEPGATYVYPWRGIVWEVITATCGSLSQCQRPIGSLTGEAAIEVRYSDSFREAREFGADDQFINEPVRTRRVNFRYVDGAETRIELQ